MLEKIRKIIRREDGQGITEYIIIVALIFIASIGIMTLYGNNLRRIWGVAVNALTGDTNVVNKSITTKPAMIKKDLKNFGQKNAAP